MKIETKYDINKDVWIMSGNKPTSFKINQIRIISTLVDKGNYTCAIENTIEYRGYGSDAQWHNEHNLFASKEELKKHVFGE